MDALVAHGGCLRLECCVCVRPSQARQRHRAVLEVHADMKPVQNAGGRARQHAGDTLVIAAITQGHQERLGTDPDRLQERLLTQPLPRIMPTRTRMSARISQNPRQSIRHHAGAPATQWLP
jgi:hypothetical protein